MSCSARSRPSHSRRGATLFGACSDKRGATRKQEPGSRLPFLSSLLESNVSPSVHSSRSDSQENCPEKNGQSLVSQPAKAFTNHGCIQTQTQDILGTTPSWENAHPVPSPLLGANPEAQLAGGLQTQPLRPQFSLKCVSFWPRCSTQTFHAKTQQCWACTSLKISRPKLGPHARCTRRFVATLVERVLSLQSWPHGSQHLSVGPLEVVDVEQAFQATIASAQ